MWSLLDAVTAFFVVVAAVLFWKLANQFGAGISFKRLILILTGMFLILLAIGWL